MVCHLPPREPALWAADAKDEKKDEKKEEKKLSAATTEKLKEIQDELDAATLTSEVRSAVKDLCRRIGDDASLMDELHKRQLRDREEIKQIGAVVKKLREELKAEEELKPVSPLATATAQELQQVLDEKERLLSEARSDEADWDSQQRNRPDEHKQLTERLVAIPEQIAEARRRIENADDDETAPLLLNQARRLAAEARVLALEQQADAYQSELGLYDAEESADVLMLRFDLAKLRADRLEGEVDAWKKALELRDAEELAIRLREAQARLATAPPLLKDLYAECVAMIERDQKLQAEQHQVTESLDAVRDKLDALREEAKQTKERVDKVGLTGSLGARLRKEREGLPNASDYRRNIAERALLQERMQLAFLDLSDQRSASVVAPPELAVEFKQAQKYRTATSRELLKSYRQLLETLDEANSVDTHFVSEIEEFTTYLDERVLWIRSNRVLSPMRLYEDLDSLTWLARADLWQPTFTALAIDYERHPDAVLFWATLIVLFFVVMPRIRGQIKALGVVANKPTCCDMQPTFFAGGLTILAATLFPGIMMVLGWRLSVTHEASNEVHRLAPRLINLGELWWVMELVRQVCRPLGLAECHFQWPTRIVQRFRAIMKFWIVCTVPLFLLVALWGSRENVERHAWERLAFIAALGVIAWSMRAIVEPHEGVLHEWIVAHPGGWIDRLQKIWLFVASAMPLTLAALAGVGYYYTAERLAVKMQWTVSLVITAVLIRGMLVRWLVLRDRRLRIQQATAKGSAWEHGPTDAAGLPLIVEEQIDLDRVSGQANRLIESILLISVIAGLWWMWGDLLPAINHLDQWQVWKTTYTTTQNVKHPTTGEDQLKEILVLEWITVAHIARALLVGLLAITVARNLPSLLEIAVLQHLPLDNSIRYAITSLSRYGIVMLGILATAATIGIRWSHLQWLAAALTLGLAFGLQEIFENFVSGIIILFEQPARVGDVVTIGDVSGVVSRIRIRSTTITDWDRKEYIVPNKEFITGRLLNWTLSDTLNRIVINVAVKYTADPERVRGIITKIASQHPVVLPEPAPSCNLESLGHSSLNFVLSAYLPNLDRRSQTMHELHSQIYKALGEEALS